MKYPKQKRFINKEELNKHITKCNEWLLANKTRLNRERRNIRAALIKLRKTLTKRELLLLGVNVDWPLYPDSTNSVILNINEEFMLQELESIKGDKK